MVLLFCSLQFAHPVGMEFDFNVIAPFLPSHYHSPLLLDVMYLCVCVCVCVCVFQHPPVDGCSAGGCKFGILTENEHTYFYSTISPTIYD